MSREIAHFACVFCATRQDQSFDYEKRLNAVIVLTILPIGVILTLQHIYWDQVCSAFCSAIDRFPQKRLDFVYWPSLYRGLLCPGKVNDRPIRYFSGKFAMTSV